MSVSLWLAPPNHPVLSHPLRILTETGERLKERLAVSRINWAIPKTANQGIDASKLRINQSFGGMARYSLTMCGLNWSSSESSGNCFRTCALGLPAKLRELASGPSGSEAFFLHSYPKRTPRRSPLSIKRRYRA